jgi:hypothetical protein
MKIIVIADIHGEINKLKKVINSIKEPYDLIISPGDFTDMYNHPMEFSQMDIANLIIHKLISLHKPIFCVPGNQDPYEILNILDGFDANLHEKIRSFNSLNFIGFGGAVTPFATKFEPPEEETKTSLEKLVKDVKNNFVLLVHNPPKNTKLDKTAGGKHVGSKVIGDFIIKHKPILTVSAHIHESAGIDKLGNTTLFYPGPVMEGKYGVVEIDRGKVKCRIKEVGV